MHDAIDQAAELDACRCRRESVVVKNEHGLSSPCVDVSCAEAEPNCTALIDRLFGAVSASTPLVSRLELAGLSPLSIGMSREGVGGVRRSEGQRFCTASSRGSRAIVTIAPRRVSTVDAHRGSGRRLGELSARRQTRQNNRVWRLRWGVSAG